MNRLTRLSLKNRALIALISLVAVVFGVIGAGALKQELMPTIQLPQAVITSSYEGASPEAVEREVTEPLESAMNGLQEVESVSSVSSTGSSQIIVETAYGTDSDDVVRSLQRAVSQVEGQLPDGVQPNVFAGGIDDFPVVQMSVIGNEDTEQLAQELEDIAVVELKKIDGVREASVDGGRTQQVSVTVREDDMEDEGVSVDSLAQILQANGVPTSAGDLETEDATAPVQIGTRLTSVEDIANIAVSGSDGPVLLRDVADVELVDEEATSVSRTNGEDSLTLSVTKKPDANTVDISHEVQDALENIRTQMSGDIEFVTAFDQAPFIEQSIHDLLVEGMLGLGFAVLVILVFLLSVRATVITAISIPLSLLITLIGMWLTGYSLNMLTLGALTISIGRVVDDSIVVIEAIRRRHALGGSKFQNVLAATGEVAGAITASTLTTVAVFAPLVFVGGQTGELFRPFALTTTIALLSSLFVALTIVPVLAYWFLRAREAKVRLDRAQKKQVRQNRKEALAEWRSERKAARKKDLDVVHPTGRRSAPTGALPLIGEPEPENATEIDELASMHSPVTHLQKTYVPVVRATTKHPVLTLVVAIAILGGTFAMIPNLKTELLGDTGQDTVQATQTLAPGTELEEGSEQARLVEDVLAARPEVESYQMTIGGGMVGMMGGGGGELTANYTITLDPDADTAATNTALQEEFDALPGEAGTVTVLSSDSFTGGNDITIDVVSADSEALTTGAEDLAARLGDLDTVQSVSTDLEAEQSVVEVRIDREAAAEEGLDEQTVGRIVSRAMRGQELGTVVIDNTTHRVLLFDGSIDTVEELRDLEIQVPASPSPVPGAPAPEPETVELQDIAEVEAVLTPPTIRHTEGLRTATVTVTPGADDLGAVSADVRAVVADTDLPQGVTTNVGGATEEMEESFTQLGLAMLAAILIVFVILVATFKSLMQPLILLVSIPFAATGSIGLMLLTDTALGLTAMIGLLMLIGIVVTNAIVLIDLINHFRAHGVPLRTAVIQGARLRYRPILMTAAATIFALVPMALGLTGGGVFISKPLAIVVIGGLVSSTLLTLVLVPVLYQLLEGAKERRAEKRAIKEMARGSVLDEAEAAAEWKATTPVGPAAAETGSTTAEAPRA
ncbi:efflux RND transporter permease subunit, partial [Brevibacterium samyangense]